MPSPLLPAVASNRAPYRELSRVAATRTRVHYRPGASVWALLFVIVLTLPLAYAARRQLPGSQRTVSCTTFSAGGEHRCLVWDRPSGDVRRVPCGVAQEGLEAQLAEGGLLHGPAITVVSTVAPVESKPIPAIGNSTFLRRPAKVSLAPTSSTSDAKVAAEWNAIERPADGTIRPEDARALLAVCAGAPPAETEFRTVAFMIVPRDDRGAALVLLVGLLLLGLLAFRGSVVDIAPAASEVRIADKFGPLALRPVKIRLADVLDVVVATGTSGPFVGQRVEFVLVDGTRIPLGRWYAPFSTRAHERITVCLKRGLGLLTT